MSNYQEDVARMRAERKQAEAADQYEQLRQQYNEALENRENASLQILGNDGDRSSWDYWDQQMEEAERQLAPYIQAQRPKPHPAALEWDAQNSQYIHKVQQSIGPQQAVQRMAQLDAAATRHHPRHSEGYKKFIEDALELYSEESTGVKYDPKDKTLTWRDAAKASGLTEQEYGTNYHRLRAQGRIR